MKTENLPVPTRPGYILAMLTLMSALAFMDRQILSVVIQPVKQEFGLSDLQIGLVTGLGFALTFGVLGVPLGRLADRRERRSLIAFCRGLGGVLGLMGGASVGFLSLMFSRAGGAVSDAGGTPASMSMLADIYPAAQRARAMSVLGAGASLGALMALVLGSWLAQHHGWRFTLAVIGTASLLLALVLRWTVREPVRSGLGSAGYASSQSADSVSLHVADLQTAPSGADIQTAPRGADLPTAPSGAVAAIWAEPFTRWSILGAALALLSAYSFGTWNNALMVRHHGLSLQHAGWISGGAALMSLAGGLMAGALTDRLVRRDLRWQMRVPVLGLGLALVFGVAYLLLPSGALVPASVLVWIFSFFLPWWAAPTYAAMSLVVPSHRRATANAMVLLAGAIVGNGMGAILTGWFSDLLSTRFGDDGLRYALLGMSSMMLPAMFAFGRAMRAYPTAYRKASQTQAKPHPV